MRSRYGLLSTISAVILFILLETFSIVLVVNRGIVQRYRVLGAVRTVESWVWTHTSHIGSYLSLHAENERLAAENLQLRQQLALSEAARRALDSTDRIVEPDLTCIGARVVRNSVNRQHNFLVLDKGRGEGVETGMGVVTPQGVVGIVGGVSQHYSYVFSLLSTGQTVSVKLGGDGAFGPMTWPGVDPGLAVLHEIPVHIQAAPGDTVYTSGYSTLFPPDIPVGTVASATVSQGSSQELTVRLFQDFRTLHHVYIVKNNRREELEELYEQVR